RLEDRPAPLSERAEGFIVQHRPATGAWHRVRGARHRWIADEAAAAPARGEQGLDVRLDAVAAEPEAGLAVDGEPHQPDLERSRCELVGGPAVTARPEVGAGGRDHAGTVAERNERMAVVNAYGASSIGMWPTPGSTTSVAPSAATSGGPLAQPPASWSPHSTSAGAQTSCARAERSRLASGPSTPGTTCAARPESRSIWRAIAGSRPSRPAMPTNQPKITRRDGGSRTAAAPQARSVRARARWKGSTYPARRSSSGTIP